MSGSILEAARLDARRFLKSGGFEEEIKISTPNRSMAIITKGLATKHHISFSADGTPFNSKNVHICIDENELKEQGYPVRNQNGEVSLRRHIIDYADSSGVKKKYMVKEYYPDEVLGLIVCVLEDFKE